MVVAVAIALMLYEIVSRGVLKIYQTVLFFPHFLSWVVVAYMAYAFLNPRSGMLNQLLDAAMGRGEGRGGGRGGGSGRAASLFAGWADAAPTPK